LTFYSWETKGRFFLVVTFATPSGCFLWTTNWHFHCQS